MSAPVQAGLYSASARIYEILFGVLPLLSLSLFPTLTRWYKEDRAGFTRRYTQLTRWVTWLGLFGLAGAFALREPIVHAIFGEDFAPASRVLPWHLASAAVMYNAIFRAAYLTLAQRQIILLWTSVLGAILNLGLNLVFIPRLGAEGAAMAGFLTQVVALHLSYGLFRETRWLLNVSLLSLFIPFRPVRCS